MGRVRRVPARRLRTCRTSRAGRGGANRESDREMVSLLRQTVRVLREGGGDTRAAANGREVFSVVKEKPRRGQMCTGMILKKGRGRSIRPLPFGLTQSLAFIKRKAASSLLALSGAS